MKHLKQWSEFRAVMSVGSLACSPHFALYRWQHSSKVSINQETSTLFTDRVLRIGALTPKRLAKKAVTRNLIRRQILVVSRSFEKTLVPTAYVVRLRATFDLHEFISASSCILKNVVNKELEQLFKSVSVQ